MHHIRLTGFTALLALLAVVPAEASAQSASGPYVIAPVAIVGGGGTLGGGSFVLSGTLGQPATTLLTAGTYRLQDGFWAPASAPETDDTIFINGFDP